MKNNDSLSLYTLIRQVGEGSFSKVFEVLRPNNEIQCLKVVKQDDGRGLPSEIIREIAMLTHLHSNWIVRLKEVSEDIEKKNILVFFERIETDLQQFCLQHTLMPNAVKIILRNVLLGVDYMHSKGVVHRDLKPSNLLIEPNTLDVKIGDLGFAFRLNLDIDDTEEVLAGTLAYLAPEQITRKIYFSYETDVWSIGCVFVELILGKPLFNFSCFENILASQLGFFEAFFGSKWINNQTLATNIKPQTYNEENTLKLKLGECGIDFIKKILNPYPKERWRTSQLLSHSFLNN